ncbi:MAG: hypothetical protein Q4C95_08345 [Planctomycetia bacterium]|nr:hypothetical protein [Planctomycetia bacterium]
MNRYFLIIALSLICLGCGSGNKMVKVNGTITLNGEPIPKGTIQFIPVDGNTSEGGGLIEDGKYTVNVEPGEKIVRVRGKKIVGQKETSAFTDPDTGVSSNTVTIDIEEQITSDDIHWTNSKLKVNVEKGSKEPIDITL